MRNETEKSVARAAAALVAAEEEVKRVEEELKEKKEAARLISEETIPGLMEEIGLQSMTLDSGQKITVKEDVFAAIPKSLEEQAFGWLDEHGYGGLIKVDVIVSFARDEAAQAYELANKLLEDGFRATCVQKVHPQTLKAFLREKLKEGANLPLETFGARPIIRSVVK